MTESQKATLIVMFGIEGNLRFLSHQETVAMFQRGLVRAGVEVAYSQGFNPRPKMSLPLPRTVGVESCDDMLCVSLSDECDELDRIRDDIAGAMPAGCSINSVSIRRGKFSRQASMATYIFPISGLAGDGSFKSKVVDLEAAVKAGEQLLVERWAGKDKKKRSKDVGGFVESVSIKGDDLVVKSRISDDGSIRVDEVMHLLEIEQEQLSGPVVRKSVQW